MFRGNGPAPSTLERPVAVISSWLAESFPAHADGLKGRASAVRPVTLLVMCTFKWWPLERCLPLGLGVEQAEVEVGEAGVIGDALSRLDTCITEVLLTLGNPS